MSQENTESEPTPEEVLFQQARQAVGEEKFERAREILKSLLQNNQQNPDYWVWLSAALETKKERLYCLQTAYKLDPTCTAARRGLVIMGDLAADDTVEPFPMDHPRPWEAALKKREDKNEPTGVNKLRGSPRLGLVLAIGAISLIIIFTRTGSFLTSQQAASKSEPFSPTGTARPTVTPLASTVSQTYTQKTKPSLAELLKTEYTPTPIYAATPHGEAAGDSYNGAIRAYKKGQWDLVGLMMVQVATAHPGSADALYFIGEANRLSGKYHEAINYYNAAIGSNAYYAPSYLGRARANNALGSKENVIVDLDKAIDLDMNYAEAYIERGMVYLGRRDLKSAQSDLEQAIRLNDSPLAELNLARVLLAKNENLAALQAARLANQLDLTMLDGYLVLGMAYRANGELDQAVDVLEIYLDYKPDNSEAFAVLGAAYFNRDDYTAAEKNLKQAIRLDKTNPDGYYWLGQTYLALEETDKALENFRKARELDSNWFDASAGVANAYMAKGEFNNSYSAIAKAERLIQNKSERAQFLFIRAKSLDELHQPAPALRDWNELLALPEEATTSEMREAAQERVAALKSATPTATSAITATPTVKASTTP